MEDTTVNAIPEVRTKFCKYCGGKIHEDAVLCLHCGRQVEEVKKAEQPNIVINNSNQTSIATPISLECMGAPQE